MNGPYGLCSGYVRMYVCTYDRVNVWIQSGGQMSCKPCTVCVLFNAMKRDITAAVTIKNHHICAEDTSRLRYTDRGAISDGLNI